MARGINKVILVGNLGRDPETRYLPSGDPVTNFSIATSDGWRDKQSGQMQERTEWHNIVCFNRLAEIASEYLRKGSKVYLEGQLRTQSWEKDGQKHYKTEIVAREMQMLDSRGGGGGMGDAGMDAGGAPSGFESRQRGGGGKQQAPAYDNRPTLPADDVFDDDIPF
ncbi:MAG: single-stranded DNA-binding protein [Gammaproteobacteria bacterium]|nr:single-stranded DNA-binding protein [Gammaproteobacteria bacterium]